MLIDCPPSLGLLTVNALTAADSVLIPLQCEYYALEGLTQLLATLDLVRDNLNPDLAIKGVVLTMFDGADEPVGRRRGRGPPPPRRRGLRHGRPAIVRLSEAPSHGLPIQRYSPDSTGRGGLCRARRRAASARRPRDRRAIATSGSARR